MSFSLRVSSCGDFAPKWRFWRPSGARLLVAIRHLKSGDFGKLVETPKKVAFSEPNLAIFGVLLDSTFPPALVTICKTTLGKTEGTLGTAPFGCSNLACKILRVNTTRFWPRL